MTILAILGWVLTAVVAVMLGKGAVEKIIGTQEMVGNFAFMKLEGSGWVYLAYDGKIKTIKNHEVRNDILLLVDRWEHAWILDYGSDKKRLRRAFELSSY